MVRKQNVINYRQTNSQNKYSYFNESKLLIKLVKLKSANAE